MSISCSERIRICGESGAIALSLDDLGVEAIPPELFELRHLQILSLRNNRLRHIPDDIILLQSLRSIYLENNRLEQIPGQLFAFKNLKNINLSSNLIESCSSETVDHDIDGTPASWGCRMLPLETLILRQNRLKQMPWFLRVAPNLRVVDLSQNQIEKFDKRVLSGCKKLEVFLMDENPCIRGLRGSLADDKPSCLW